MDIKIIIAISAIISTATPAIERVPLLPALQTRDILLCGELPKRTSIDTALTMYQLARLGYSSVRTFQQDSGLKVDGIIGTQTQAKIEEIFRRTFGPLARAQTNAPLSLASEIITNAVTASLNITLSNKLNAAVRIVGVLGTDSDNFIRFSGPALSVSESFCRHNPKTGMVGCGGGSHMAQMSTTGTILQAGSTVCCSTVVSRLLPNEDGSVSVGLHYLTSDGTSFQTSERQKRPR